MTSQERKDARRQRRMAKRTNKKNEFLKTYNDFSLVADINNLHEAFKKSRKGVSWKESVQRYESDLFLNLMETKRKLLNGESISKGFVEFNIHERGKLRHIRSIHISERVVQKCLCDQILVPLLTKSLIYDNGASVKNKGIAFSMKRLRCHLSRFYRRNGFSNKGYVLSIDFSKYFDNIRHDKLLEIMRNFITDERVFELYKAFITVFGDNVSLGLGSQVSQISAITYPNELDHFCKEILRIRYYGRYMDDIYLIHESKEYLEYCLEEIERICAELGIKLNEKKTKIVPLDEGFWFLKGKYILTATGKIICKTSNDGAKRMRRKLRKFIPKVESGKMTLLDVYTSYQSFRSHLRLFDSYHKVRRMDKYFDKMFVFNPNIIYGGGEYGRNSKKGVLGDKRRCSSASH